MFGIESHSHVFLARKTDEAGSRNFVFDEKQNIRDQFQCELIHFEKKLFYDNLFI